MKTCVSKIIICVAILTSALSYSQNWQPKKIQYQGNEGVFISFPVMDSISLRLIDRKSLLSESITYKSIFTNLQQENSLLNANFLTLTQTSNDYKLALKKTEEQLGLLQENLNAQVEITKNNKKKARRNGLLLFGGGITVGLVGLVLLL